MAKQCYMCDAAGKTKEHVPPLSFFPKGHRDNLVTVPSCEKHNSDNAPDVEYVRNVIVSHHATNDLARTHFQGPVLRSFRHSPGLFRTTFRDSTPVLLQERETGLVRLDMGRFTSVMKSIAYARYFKDFGRAYLRDWVIYSPSLVVPESITQGISDPFNESLRGLFRALPFTEMRTTHPEVFKYAIHHETETDVFYRFEFYGGFIVHAVRYPKPIASEVRVAV